MTQVLTRSDPAEVIRHGKEIYETSLRDRFEPEHIREYLIIETETGQSEIIPTREALAKRLHEKGPSTTRYIMRIGFAAFVKKGGGAPSSIVCRPVDSMLLAENTV